MRNGACLKESDMAELGKITPKDLSVIDPTLRFDVLYWCRELGCTETRLRATIDAVGPSVADVRRQITGRWK